MNSAKEKKLNAIKSEILEIKEFLSLNENDENSDINTENVIDKDINNTYTLTNIVGDKQKVPIKDDLAEIKKELYTLKSMLTRQEIVLKKILSKIN